MPKSRALSCAKLIASNMVVTLFQQCQINLYGPGDNFDLETSHVAALIRKSYEGIKYGSEEIEIWGSGKARREFLHVDDCASGIIFLLKNYSGMQHVNLGTGVDITIRDLANRITQVVGFSGKLKFDQTKPDGTPRKLMNVGHVASLGWSSKIKLNDGLVNTFEWFLKNLDNRI